MCRLLRLIVLIEFNCVSFSHFLILFFRNSLFFIWLVINFWFFPLNILLAIVPYHQIKNNFYSPFKKTVEKSFIFCHIIIMVIKTIDKNLILSLYSKKTCINFLTFLHLHPTFLSNVPHFFYSVIVYFNFIEQRRKITFFVVYIWYVSNPFVH